MRKEPPVSMSLKFIPFGGRAMRTRRSCPLATHTAAGDVTPGTEGLSGLAKAFFYAGSWALLVSHWPVVSDAAVAITTRMLKEARKPGIGRSEAHRLAMMALIEDTDHPHYAHPMFAEVTGGYQNCHRRIRETRDIRPLGRS